MKRLILFIILAPALMMAQHSIEGTFTPPDDFTYAFLYKSSPSGAEYVERGKVDKDGHFKIELDESNPAGIYKIVYGVPQDVNNFDLIYNGEENINLNFSLEEGLEFVESNENKLWASYTKSIEMINRTIGNFYTQNSKDKAAYNEIFKSLTETQAAFEEASKGTMAYQFIIANTPYIPSDFEDIDTYSQHLKETYLEHVDFSNPLLQSSEFLTDRVMAFVFGMAPDADADFYKQQIDRLVDYIGPDNKEVKKALLQMLWFNMVDIENTEAANYIADTYLMKLSEDAGDKILMYELKNYKRNAVGAIAQDFPITLQTKGKTKETTLHQLSVADNYLLIFWNSGCSHCLEQLPKIKTKIDGIDSKKIKVIAYGTQGDLPEWHKEIAKYPNFIHVIDPGNSDKFMGREYGVEMTPTFFILDKNKKIIVRPNTLDELFEALDNL